MATGYSHPCALSCRNKVVSAALLKEPPAKLGRRAFISDHTLREAGNAGGS